MGQTKYNNFKKLLEENNYEVCSFEDFVQTDKISYKCKKGHKTKMAPTSFQNKKSKTTDFRTLCTECFSEITSLALFEEQKIKILNHTGHKLKKPLPERKIEYTCGTCESVQISTFSNLIKPASTRFCSKCINDRTAKKTMDQVQLDFADLKLESNDLNEYCVLKYETNKNVTFKCNAGHVFKTSFFDIKRGRRCPTCSPIKRAETNLQKYGHANVFASLEVKEKIKETNLKKFGETHHMKVKEIRDKAVQTNLEKIGVRYAFHIEESFNKIRMTCFEKYGVEYPFQSKCIRDKSKQTCLDKYGVDHPMKTIEVFSKVKNSFRRKPFTFPSGRVDYVLGYEPIALEELLKTYDEADIITSVWCIPTFDYNRVSSKLRSFKTQDTEKPCCSFTASPFSLVKKTIKSRYFPDIMLPDKIIEVKSSYYYQNDKENVMKKMAACVRNGYSAELWVYKDENTIDFKLLFSMKNNFVVCRFFK